MEPCEIEPVDWTVSVAPELMVMPEVVPSERLFELFTVRPVPLGKVMPMPFIVQFWAMTTERGLVILAVVGTISTSQFAAVAQSEPLEKVKAVVPVAEKAKS